MTGRPPKSTLFPHTPLSRSPHHIDNKGRYRRYVARQITVDALLGRVEQPGERDRGELLFEAAAVLAGTVLMATGIRDRKSTRLNSSHANISYAVFCLKKKKN